MIKKTMEQQVDFTYNEFLYQNGQTNKLQSNIKYPGYRLKKDFKNVTHNIKALKDVYWKGTFVPKYTANVFSNCGACVLQNILEGSTNCEILPSRIGELHME